jgi:hypothetical protein
MIVAGTPINPPEMILIDRRDFNSLRDRVLHLEEELRRQAREMALFQQGAKERFDVISVLLARLEDTVAREKLG